MRRNPGLTIIEVVIVFAVLVIFAVFFLLPMLPQKTAKVRTTMCMNNQRQIAVAVQTNALDHGGMLPRAATVWRDLNLKRRTLTCPEPGQEKVNGYVYNAALSGKSVGKFTNPTAVMLTCDGKTTYKGGLPNTCYEPQDIDWRHMMKYTVTCFLDGHVEIVKTFDGQWFGDGRKGTFTAPTTRRVP